MVKNIDFVKTAYKFLLERTGDNDVDREAVARALYKNRGPHPKEKRKPPLFPFDQATFLRTNCTVWFESVSRPGLPQCDVSRCKKILNQLSIAVLEKATNKERSVVLRPEGTDLSLMWATLQGRKTSLPPSLDDVAAREKEQRRKDLEFQRKRLEDEKEAGRLAKELEEKKKEKERVGALDEATRRKEALAAKKAKTQARIARLEEERRALLKADPRDEDAIAANFEKLSRNRNKKEMAFWLFRGIGEFFEGLHVASRKLSKHSGQFTDGLLNSALGRLNLDDAPEELVFTQIAAAMDEDVLEAWKSMWRRWANNIAGATSKPVEKPETAETWATFVSEHFSEPEMKVVESKKAATVAAVLARLSTSSIEIDFSENFGARRWIEHLCGNKYAITVGWLGQGATRSVQPFLASCGAVIGSTGNQLSYGAGSIGAGIGRVFGPVPSKPEVASYVPASGQVLSRRELVTAIRSVSDVSRTAQNIQDEIVLNLFIASMDIKGLAWVDNYWVADTETEKGVKVSETVYNSLEEAYTKFARTPWWLTI